MKDWVRARAGRLMGGLFVLALVCGGATERSVADSALLVVASLLSALVLSALPHTRIAGPILWFPLLALGAVAVQLVPLPYALAKTFWPQPVVDAIENAGAPAFAFLTLSVADTLYALAATLTAALVFWAYACLDRSRRKTVYKAILYGIALNLAVATFQFMMSAPYSTGFFGYPVTIGAFQNGNHFGTLILIAIPALVYLMRRGWTLTGLTMLSLMLLLLLGAHTLAGAGLSVVMIVLAFLLVPRRHGGTSGAPHLVVALVMIVSCVAFAVAFRNQAFDQKMTSGARRVDIWTTSLEAAKGSKWLGVGYGAFRTGYQIYEKPSEIDVAYINQAHDEYISMLVEGGALAAILMAIYFVLLAERIAHDHRSPYRRIALLGVLAVLLHSAVDYPARAFAILFIFVALNAEVFLPHEEPEPSRRGSGRAREA